MTSDPATRWLTQLESRPDAHCRLICAHHAGGSSQYFESWSAELSAEFEVVAIELPGRGVRRNEPLVRSLVEVVNAVCNEMRRFMDRPYAMFGDSIGTLVCFEVIRELRRRGDELPVRLFASGMVAPHIVWWDTEAPLHTMGEAALFDGLVHDAGMLDAASLANPELREIMTPVLQADLEIAETYTFINAASLSVPITASRGDADILLTPEQLQGWSKHTDSTFEHVTFPGAHFYTRDHRREVLELVSARLRDDLAELRTSIVEGATHPYPHATLHELFSEQAASTPDALALAQHDRRYSYRELDRKTDALAHWLIAKGVRSGGLVGILMERCIEHVIALVAINKAGAVFMALDTNYPAETVGRFIDVSDASIVLSKPQWIDQMPESVRGLCEWVSLADDWQADLAVVDVEQGHASLPDVDPDSTAFVSMSSGTSGAPKGIRQSHRAAVNAYWHRYLHAAYGDHEREACNVYFIWYVWLPLLRGASAWIVPDDVIYDPQLLAEFIDEHAITRSTISPSLLERVIRTPGLDLRHQLRSLRNVTIIGEVVPSALVKEFHAIAPECTLTHAYGCAETHDAASTTLDSAGRSRVTGGVAPVGGPQINQRIYVLDNNRTPVPRGVAGEIYVGGDSLANGYHRDARNTARRFIADPVAPDRGRMFRTGDRGRILSNGTLQVLGRLDAMVKLRGYSVMLGAVEAALLEHPAISNAVVVATTDDTTGRPDHLVAYIVERDRRGPANWRGSLRAFLSDRLPHYAIPTYVVAMQSLPVDGRSNSKVNRRGLPEPQLEHRLISGAERRPPRDERESAILASWCTILDLDADAIGLDDDFFALGGHSLLAAELCSHLNEQFDCDLRVAEVLALPTVAQLADRIGAAHGR